MGEEIPKSGRSAQFKKKKIHILLPKLPEKNLKIMIFARNFSLKFFIEFFIEIFVQKTADFTFFVKKKIGKWEKSGWSRP